MHCLRYLASQITTIVTRLPNLFQKNLLSGSPCLRKPDLFVPPRDTYVKNAFPTRNRYTNAPIYTNPRLPLWYPAPSETCPGLVSYASFTLFPKTQK